MTKPNCSIDGCPNTATCKGMCHKHYCRVWRNGTVCLNTFLTRFLSRIKRTRSCWLWTGTILFSGYGTLKRGGTAIRAHRASWEIYNGPIPDNMQVLHKCDVPKCVNPDHLFLGTHIDNMRDMEAKGRAKWIQDNLRAKRIQATV